MDQRGVRGRRTCLIVVLALVAAAVVEVVACSIHIESGVEAHHSEAGETPIAPKSPTSTPTAPAARG